MKKVALMQPYLFPYIGYFQLINAVDEFIIYDDVQYIKGGWINRNRILASDEVEYITLPVAKGSRSLSINERFFADNVEQAKTDILERLREGYGAAPFYSQAMPVVEKCLNSGEKNVAHFVENVLLEVCAYMGVTTPFVRSSSLPQSDGLRSQDRVIDIVRSVNADQYVNAIGGRELYSNKVFEESGMELSFLESLPVAYHQFNDTFVSNLSIIDIMMFNSRDKIREMLNNYRLV